MKRCGADIRSQQLTGDESQRLTGLGITNGPVKRSLPVYDPLPSGLDLTGGEMLDLCGYKM